MHNIHPPFDLIDSSDVWGVGNIAETQVAGVGKKRHRYVKFLDAVTYAPGQVVTPANAAMTSVTNDISGGSSTTALTFAGVVIGTPTQNTWGWVQESGYHAAVVTNGDDDIAQGDTVIMGAADGVVDSVAKATRTGTLSIVGIAADVDVDAANTVPVWLGGVLIV